MLPLTLASLLAPADPPAKHPPVAARAPAVTAPEALFGWAWLARDGR